MVNGKAVVTARAKARQAKAALDVERAKQDRLVVDAATEFYEAVDALTAAREAVAAAEQQQTKSVTRLSELGQTDEQVATLCGVAVKEVRDLRRRPSADPSTAARADDSSAETVTAGAAPADDGSSAETVAAA